MTPLNPINFKNWINDHRDQLKPPVCNQVVWEDREFIIMVVGGPNERMDYHSNPGEEFFHQLEGDMILKVHENGQSKEVPIKEGEILLIPPRCLHAPKRFANTVGLVVERKRIENEIDHFVWFCEGCDAPLDKISIHLENIVSDLPPVFQKHYSDPNRIHCNHCGRDNPKVVTGEMNEKNRRPHAPAPERTPEV